VEEATQRLDDLRQTQESWTKKSWQKRVGSVMQSDFGSERHGGSRGSRKTEEGASDPVATPGRTADSETPLAVAEGGTEHVASDAASDRTAEAPLISVAEAGTETQPVASELAHDERTKRPKNEQNREDEPMASDEDTDATGGEDTDATRRHIPLHHSESTPTAGYDHSGVAAFMQPTIAPARKMRFAPQAVVNWIYQTLGLAIMVLQKLMGSSASFHRNGSFIDEKTGKPASGGMICAFWGTELGARREQAMIAWDYDADLAVFKTPDLDFASVWSRAQELLKQYGVRLIEHSPGFKYRICPIQPVAFHTTQERRHEARLENPQASRPLLMQMASRSQKRHEVLQNPTGINCVDIEVYSVSPGKDLRIQGAEKNIPVPPESVFPIVEGIFGPLRVPLPATTAILDAEYGSQWRHTRSMKWIANNCKANLMDVPGHAQRSVWPSMPMIDCKPLLGGFWGAGLKKSKEDVPWRFL